MKILALVTAVGSLLLAAACGSPAETPTAEKETDTKSTDAGSSGEVTAQVEFRDTFEGALEEAKERNTLVMLDFWAPW